MADDGLGACCRIRSPSTSAAVAELLGAEAVHRRRAWSSGPGGRSGRCWRCCAGSSCRAWSSRWREEVRRTDNPVIPSGERTYSPGVRTRPEKVPRFARDDGALGMTARPVHISACTSTSTSPSAPGAAATATSPSRCGARCRRDRFVDAVLQRMARLAGSTRRGTASPRVDTIYFGGGTPSRLEPGGIAALLERHRAATARVAADAEITLEANPDDVTPRRAPRPGAPPG